MPKFIFSELSQAKLESVVKIHEKGIIPDKWNKMVSELTEQDRQKINMIQTCLVNYKLSLMNEATIWSRAIYPLLMLAETENIQAWSEVPLKAQYPHFELEGIVDGILGNCISGMISTPYLVVAEARRGLEAQNPQFQLYGEMLAAAWLNRDQNQKTDQEIFGCYTISDAWTFVCGSVREFEAEYPVMEIESSREYIQRTEAEAICRILKFIVSKYGIS